jgi:hypothetical protein
MLRKALHWLAHLLWINEERPDFRRGGRVCEGCGRFTPWEQGGL